MVAKRINPTLRKDSPHAEKNTHTTPNGSNSPPETIDAGFSIAQAAPAILDYYAAQNKAGTFLSVGRLLRKRLGLRTTAHDESADWYAFGFWLSSTAPVELGSTGSALTFSQMLFITIQLLPTFLEWPSGRWTPRLKPRQVPLHRWAIQVVVLTTGSLLNNWAFAYQVPLTLLIVFRSAGLAVSMLFGVVFLKKRYSIMQIVSSHLSISAPLIRNVRLEKMSVITVSVGVVLATLSKPKTSTSTSSNIQSSEELWRYLTGVTMLVVSLFLTAFLGILQEKTYKKFGPCWKEGVFYTHFLSLPAFLFLVPDIKQGYHSLSDGPSTSSSFLSFLILGGNLISQLICVSGVNRLSSQVSSVSTNLVLTARKALSLCLSVWWFGNGWNAHLGVGAAMVFVGSAMFSAAGDEKIKKQ
ncbi:hypothetical protein H0H87_009680 [Tephrocybe sp. NHM501043]|nr:hypothetical protein H0H87_009680 [Tephrocybe sp. NHM501043]